MFALVTEEVQLGQAKQQNQCINYEFFDNSLAILVFHNWRGATRREDRS